MLRFFVSFLAIVLLAGACAGQEREADKGAVIAEALMEAGVEPVSTDDACAEFAIRNDGSITEGEDVLDEAALRARLEKLTSERSDCVFVVFGTPETSKEQRDTLSALIEEYPHAEIMHAVDMNEFLDNL